MEIATRVYEVVQSDEGGAATDQGQTAFNVVERTRGGPVVRIKRVAHEQAQAWVARQRRVHAPAHPGT